MMSCQRDYVTPRGERFLAVRLFLPNIAFALFYTHLRLCQRKVEMSAFPQSDQTQQPSFLSLMSSGAVILISWRPCANEGRFPMMGAQPLLGGRA